MTLGEVRTMPSPARGKLATLLGPTALAAASLCALPAVPAPPAQLPDLRAAPVPEPKKGGPVEERMVAAPLSADAAIRFALQNNPEIAALRQQHGIAVAGIIIAKEYPFNPIWESGVRKLISPAVGRRHQLRFHSAEVGNRFSKSAPGAKTPAAAAATLSRTDWEIANQEVTLAVHLRALRHRRLPYFRRAAELIEEAIALNQKAAEHRGGNWLKLRRPGDPTPADVIVEARHRGVRRPRQAPAADRPGGRWSLAWHELYRSAAA